MKLIFLSLFLWKQKQYLDICDMYLRRNFLLGDGDVVFQISFIIFKVNLLGFLSRFGE